jgi:hypothetical protein
MQRELHRHPDAAPSIVVKPFPLWREPAGLAGALRDVAARFGAASAMAITMTGELADCFATKREGVVSILDAFRAAFPGAVLWVYGVDGRFRSVEAASRRPLAVAAANWMASATLVARTFPDALSSMPAVPRPTSSDPRRPGCRARPQRSGAAANRRARHTARSARRCAIVRAVPLRAAAVVSPPSTSRSAPMHLWLGRIREQDYTCETPDGRGRTRADAAARIARMVCADLEMLATTTSRRSPSTWHGRKSGRSPARSAASSIDPGQPVRRRGCRRPGCVSEGRRGSGGLTTTDLGRARGGDVDRDAGRRRRAAARRDGRR